MHSRVRPLLVRALLLLALALSAATPAAGQSLAATLKGAVAPEKGAAPAPRPTLEEAVAEQQGKVEAVRAEYHDSRGAGAGPRLDAKPEELAERDRLLRSLLRVHEQHATALQSLQEVRRSQQDLEARAASWDGFPEQTSFSIDMVDGLRAAIAAKHREIQAAEVELTLVAEYLSEYQSELRDADQALRSASERLEQAAQKSSDPAAERRMHWLRELAQVRVRFYRAAIARFEAQRKLIEETLTYQRQSLDFLERQAALAGANAPLSEAELERKLEQIAAERNHLQEQIAAAEKADESAQDALQRVREELRATREAAAGEDADANAGEAIAVLQTRLDVRKTEADTASQALEALRLRQDALTVEESVWQQRFVATTGRGERVEQAWERLTATLSKVALWKSYVASNHEAAQALKRAQERRVADWSESDGDLKLEQQKLAALEQREAQTKQLLEKTNAVEQLLHRYREELVERREAVPVTEQVTTLMKELLAWAREAWNLELFTIEDTLSVDGQEVTGKRSVTVSKVATVVLIVAAGLWLAGVVARRAEGFLMRRLQFEAHAAVLLYRVLYGTLILGLLIFAFTSVQIPLTVFAFLGGALAIGIGFGAQNLINNFISGIILLLERPIKHGDIVDVEGVRGKVTVIGGRCSTVRSFDGLDMLIPNSAFLEKNVVNWTLSDMKRRIDIRVNVAHGSPTREVARLLEYAADGHGKILSDPAPLVTMSEFGEYALVFTVYFWVELSPDTDPRVVASDVRHRIDRLFREAGVTLAFPQRDVHLDAARPLPVQVVAPEPARGDGVERPRPAGLAEIELP